MKSIEPHIQQLVFKYAVMMRWEKGWGLFSLKNNNTHTHDWFHVKPLKKGEGGTSLQLRCHWKEAKKHALPFNECLQWAIDHDIFCENSEQF